jgi:hypothetical protein
MRIVLLSVGLLLLLAIEILRVYFIMPFPGSQRAETIEIAYFIHNNIVWFRLIGLMLIAYPLYHYFKTGSKTAKIVIAVLLVGYAVVFYLFNFKFLADKMFLLPETTAFLGAGENKIPVKQLVIGVKIGNESKAYPIEIIGYHHQVRDTLNGQPIMVTYCTVCRTGRVFSPKVEGKPENFRLVGMDHFNAMFEDSQTGSWWRQVNGEAIVGPLKGKMLDEIPSEQMSLSAWIENNPTTQIMQEDSVFKEKYTAMNKYDEGKSEGDLTRPDSLQWKEKSWIVGVQQGMESKAYDWKDLQKIRVINDQIGKNPLVVTIESDSVSFHAFSRIVDQDTLSFVLNNGKLTDTKTNSTWSWNGTCTEGQLAGKKLNTIQSYQEFWHSWKTFRPQSGQYIPTEKSDE